MLHDNGFYIMRCVYSLKHPLEHQITLTLIQSRESAEVDLPRLHANDSRVSLLCIAVNYLERTLQRCLCLNGNCIEVTMELSESETAPLKSFLVKIFQRFYVPLSPQMLLERNLVVLTKLMPRQPSTAKN